MCLPCKYDQNSNEEIFEELNVFEFKKCMDKIRLSLCY